MGVASAVNQTNLSIGQTKLILLFSPDCNLGKSFLERFQYRETSQVIVAVTAFRKTTDIPDKLNLEM